MTTLYTYKDATEHITDYLGAVSDAKDARDARRAVQDALRDMQAQRDWSVYLSHGRLVTVAPYSTGTIVFDFTGGSSERLVTLTDGTFPSWAAYGYLVIGVVRYEVSARLSDTTLQLSENSNPGEDVASTAYRLQRESYPVPTDFGKIVTNLFEATNCIELSRVHGREALRTNRYLGVSEPCAYAITGSGDFQGTVGFELTPIPSTAKTYDYLYIRRPRPLKYESVTDGTVTVTAGSTTVTGTSTAFVDAHVGSVIRLSVNTTTPDSLEGDNPYTEERIITEVASATSLTVDAAWDTAHTDVAYRISDPVDIDVNVMLNAFRYGCKAKVAQLRSKDDRAAARAAYLEELRCAAALDNRDGAPSFAGTPASRSWQELRVKYGTVGAPV